jgi:hypothetical protein
MPSFSLRILPYRRDRDGSIDTNSDTNTNTNTKRDADSSRDEEVLCMSGICSVPSLQGIVRPSYVAIGSLVSLEKAPADECWRHSN